MNSNTSSRQELEWQDHVAADLAMAIHGTYRIKFHEYFRLATPEDVGTHVICTNSPVSQKGLLSAKPTRYQPLRMVWTDGRARPFTADDGSEWAFAFVKVVIG